MAILASQGILSKRDIADAWRGIGIEPTHGPALTDEIIINQFRSRLADVAPAQREEQRRHLKTIGIARGSESIQREASESIDTYEEALSWLDLDASQPDDFVVTMFSLKVGTPLLSKSQTLIIYRLETTLRVPSPLEKQYLSSPNIETATGSESTCILGR